jgi:hypothetical protein
MCKTAVHKTTQVYYEGKMYEQSFFYHVIIDYQFRHYVHFFI